MTLPRMATLKQASDETGLSYHCLRQLCLENKVVSIRSGKKFLVNMTKLSNFLNGEKQDAEGGLNE